MDFGPIIKHTFFFFFALTYLGVLLVGIAIFYNMNWFGFSTHRIERSIKAGFVVANLALFLVNLSLLIAL